MINSLNKTDKLNSFYYEDAKTMYELFLRGQKKSSNESTFSFFE